MKQLKTLKLNIMCAPNGKWTKNSEQKFLIRKVCLIKIFSWMENGLNGLKNQRQLIKVLLKQNYSLNDHLRNNSQWPRSDQNLLLKILKSYCCKYQGTFSPEVLSAYVWPLRYRQKCPSSQIELKLNSFSDSKAGHFKNLKWFYT